MHLSVYNYMYMYLYMLLLLDFNLVNYVSCQEVSVRKIIESRQDLSTIAGDKYLKFTDVMVYMGNTQNKNLIFFAPHNNAILNMSDFLRNQLLSASINTINDLFSYHLVSNDNSNFDPTTSAEGLKMKFPTNYKSTYIFVNKLPGGVTFINGAKILTANLRSSNGVVHIIDKMFVEVGLTNRAVSGVNAFDYMKGNDVLSQLYILFSTYQYLSNQGSIQFSSPNSNAVNNYLAVSNGYCTLFAPNNNFLEAYKIRNNDLYSRISGQSPATTKMVLESLVVPNSSYHIEALEYLSSNNITINALNGWIKVYNFNGKYHVVNQCGQATVITSNIATSNCIVHVIDNFLGLVGKDLFDEVKAQSDLMDFQKTIYSLQSNFILSKLQVTGGPEYVVPENLKYTLFAPTAEIFYYIDFSSDSATKIDQLSMTIMPGVIDLSSVTESFKVNTLRNGFQATISKVGQDIFVEVNHVTARVVQSNICTKNGLIHKINKILGVPEAIISTFLLRYPIYRQVYNTLQETGLLTLFINPTNQLTLFAPNGSAITNLDPMFLGQQNKKKLKDLMSRHVANSVVFLDESKVGQTMVVDTYNGPVVISFSDGAFYLSVGEQKVKVIQANIRMQNGVIHIVDNFLRYQQVSSANLHIRSTFAMFCVLISNVWLS